MTKLIPLDPYKIILTVLLICLHKNACAEPIQCNISGEWYETTSTFKIELKQDGTQVSMANPIFHPTCGQQLTDGVIENNNLNLKTYFTNTEESYCQIWSQITGTFAQNDCSKINGEITIHFKIGKDNYESKMPFSWFRKQIKIISPDPYEDLIISGEPKMPTFVAIAKVMSSDELLNLSSHTAFNGGKLPYTWKLKINTSASVWSYLTEMDDVNTDSLTFTPNFNLLKIYHAFVPDGIVGGELILSINYNHSHIDEKKYQIKGTNPGKLAIEEVLYDPILRHIACEETNYKQFEAKLEGGIGVPVIGKVDGEKIGGVGMMQLYDPEPEVHQIWNWRNNIKGGIEAYAVKRNAAASLPDSELTRVNKFREMENKKRKTNKLAACESLPPLSEEQLLRETLRRYNGGREYRFEPADDPNCEGQWVLHPTLKSEHADPDYVNKVLNCEVK